MKQYERYPEILPFCAGECFYTGNQVKKIRGVRPFLFYLSIKSRCVMNFREYADEQ